MGRSRHDGKCVRRFFTEPLTWFLLLGGMLFLAGQLIELERKPRILLDQATVEALIARRQALEMRLLDAGERQAAIDEWVADEILYREAYRRGLDRDDRIRRALILKMRSELTGELAPPSEEVLRAWFEGRRDRYRGADRPAEYDAVRPYLPGDWLMEQSRQAVLEAVTRLRGDYVIVIEGGQDG